MQMHYYQSPNAEQASDQSGYMFTTTDSVEHTIQMLPLGFQGFNIPAGDPEYVEGVEFNMPFNIKIWGVFPHMRAWHRIFVTLPDEDEDDQCIVSSDGYDFNNQVAYIFDEPIRVEKEQPMQWACRWDNSSDNPYQNVRAPTKNIGYGERTDEENVLRIHTRILQLIKTSSNVVQCLLRMQWEIRYGD